MGRPGEYSNDEVQRKKSALTRIMEGSGLNPGMMGLRGCRDMLMDFQTQQKIWETVYLRVGPHQANPRNSDYQLSGNR